jgi:LmbE family N-acetylglucosaminyl deacetylase
MFKIVLAPHNDDEALFCAYTIIREKPLVIVVTDGFNQTIYGRPTDWLERRKESIRAMNILGASVVFLSIKDTELTDLLLIDRLSNLNPDEVYAPAVQGGHHHHDLIGKVAKTLFNDKVKYYSNYSKKYLFVMQGQEIKPTPEEIELKNRALAEYRTQKDEPHFLAVKNKSEYFIC